MSRSRPALAVPALILAATACGPSRPETLIPDLRYVAAVVEPPELEPGSSVDVTWEIAWPGHEDAPLDFLFVACSQIEGIGDCLEFAELALDPDYVTAEGTVTPAGYHAYFQPEYGFVTRGRIPANTFVMPYSTPFNLRFLLEASAYTQPPTSDSAVEIPVLSQIDGSLYLLVCEAGTCDEILDRVDAYIVGTPDTDDGQALLGTLVSGDYLETLSMDTTARASKRYVMSMRAEEERNRNPGVARVTFAGAETGGEPLAVPAGGSVEIGLELADDAVQSYIQGDPEEGATPAPETILARWFSTDGLFSVAVDQRSDLDNPFASTFIAPSAPGPVTVWVTLTDERFGAAYVRQSLDVQ